MHIVGWEKLVLSKCLSGRLWMHLDRMVFLLLDRVSGFTYSIYQLPSGGRTWAQKDFACLRHHIIYRVQFVGD